MTTNSLATKLTMAASTLLLAVSALAQTAADMATGEVRKVDKAAGKITLKHGDIKSLDMPAMTMVFQVRDPALLDKVKPGDKVRFSAESRDGAIVVTAIEAAP
jgi:Cu(I)/Ag(I) efflux system periplasmic protein CusF